MARLLRSTFLLQRSLFVPLGFTTTKHFPTSWWRQQQHFQGFKLGILGTSQITGFSSKGRKRSKSDGSDSGEENMSKKDLALQQALDQINSAFGKGSIIWLGRSASPKNVLVVSTGSFALDIALGDGGLPKEMVYKIAKDENLVETPKTNVKRKRSSGKENESGTKEYGENLVGLWIKVWWPEDREFYKGVICSFDPFKKKHQVNYDDGEVEYYVLKRKNGRSLKPVTLI